MAKASAAAKQPTPYIEVGHSGIRQSGGYIEEEFLPELRGSRGRRVYREMAENDAVIGALLFAIEMILRGVSLRVEPGGTSPQDQEAADLVHTSLHDMSLTWQDTLSDILTMLPYGWSYLEVVYKRREGDHADPAKRSQHTDGLIGWRKLALRSQLSLDRWEMDDTGGIQGMVQAPDLGRPGVTIPIEKALLFRTKSAGGNPEGRSILRNAYPAFYYSKHVRTNEAIGVQRDLAGMPVIRIPGYLMAETATPDQKAIYEAYKKLGERVNNNGQSCIVLPSDVDHETKTPLYSFELASAGGGGKRQFDTGAIIQRYNVEKAVVVLGDFILLGHEKVGSYALSTNKTDLFGAAVGGWLDGICEVINRHGIPRLLRLNGKQVGKAPRVTRGKVFAPSLKELGEYIGALSGAGMPLLPDDAVENYLRDRAGLPAKEGSDPVVGKRRRRAKVGSAAWREESES